MYIGVDSRRTSKPENGRNSVRIEGKHEYDNGLFIATFNHFPKPVCGAWPAFWMYGPNWAHDGEVDIYEGFNLAEKNHITAHTETTPGQGQCKLDQANFAGTLETSNCNIEAAGQFPNEGCRVGENSNLWGNSQGGVYALQWEKDFIKVWSWGRNSAPADVTSGAPKPSNWGKPHWAVVKPSCDVQNNFRKMKLVIDITFCGDAADNIGNWDNSVCGQTLKTTCKNYVQNNPTAFQDTYWEIKDIKVYSDRPASSTSTTKTSTATTKTSTTSSTKTGTTSATSTSKTSTTSATSTSTCQYNCGSSSTSKTSSTSATSTSKTSATSTTTRCRYNCGSSSTSKSSTTSATSTSKTSGTSTTSTTTRCRYNCGSSSSSITSKTSTTSATNTSTCRYNCGSSSTSKTSATSTTTRCRYNCGSSSSSKTSTSKTSGTSSTSRACYGYTCSSSSRSTSTSTTKRYGDSTTSTKSYTKYPTDKPYWPRPSKTSTIYATSTYTVSSCAPTVTKCPYGKTTTKVIAISTTVCPDDDDDYRTTDIPRGYTRSTIYATRTYTVTACKPEVTKCPYGQVTTSVVPVTTTICPIDDYEHKPKPTPDHDYKPKPDYDNDYKPKPDYDNDYKPKPSQDNNYKPKPTQDSDYKAKPSYDSGYKAAPSSYATAKPSASSGSYPQGAAAGTAGVKPVTTKQPVYTDASSKTVASLFSVVLGTMLVLVL